MSESSKRQRASWIALLLIIFAVVLGAGWWLRSRAHDGEGEARASASQAAATRPATGPAATTGPLGVYYVGGQVPWPGAYSFDGKPVTVKQALAAAGLPASAKGLSYVTISRTTSAGPELIKIDPVALFDRGEQDEPLRADDKILVRAAPAPPPAAPC